MACRSNCYSRSEPLAVAREDRHAQIGPCVRCRTVPLLSSTWPCPSGARLHRASPYLCPFQGHDPACRRSRIRRSGTKESEGKIEKGFRSPSFKVSGQRTISKTAGTTIMAAPAIKPIKCQRFICLSLTPRGPFSGDGRRFPVAGITQPVAEGDRTRPSGVTRIVPNARGYNRPLLPDLAANSHRVEHRGTHVLASGSC